VPSEDEVPARLHPLREYNGDKLIVTLEPEDDPGLALELGYRLARARVLARSSRGDLDAAAIRDIVERALAAMDEVRRVKSQLTGAKTSIDKARELVEAMAERVRAHLEEIDSLVGAEEHGGEDESAQATLVELD
jgi:NAD(P)-dependent dehydrogenase (short-subunit alcohol dehydrogenase family)